MASRPSMMHLDGDFKKKRFRLRAPDPWSAVALILALGCLVRDVPPEAWAALLAFVGP